MHIAVISDTHLASPTPEFTAFFEARLFPADMLLHCGDVTGEETLALLMTHPRFFGVAGNMDGFSLRSSLPETRIVSAAGLRIGMVHGWGRGIDLPHRVGALFAGKADLVLFGHTHERTLLHLESGMQLLNPGSLLFPRDDRPGYALVKIHDRGRPSVTFEDIRA